jgi:hypothetical protein
LHEEDPGAIVRLLSMSIVAHSLPDVTPLRRIVFVVLLVLLFAVAVLLGLRGTAGSPSHVEQQAPAAAPSTAI